MSGIYINGLEMPKKDGALCIVIHPDGKVCHFFDLQCEQIATAVSIPPHGRGIDADALMAVAEPIKDYQGNVKRVVWDAHINRQPTIIPADLVKEKKDEA